MGIFRRFRFSLVMAVFVVGGVASAQSLVVKRNVNLRSDASINVKPITLLTPPAQLTLLDPDKQNGFYHARTSDGKEGWVWAKNVALESTPPSPTRLGPPEIYPDSTRTPGFANLDITQANIADNLCNPIWSTSTIRPPTSYTNPLKLTQMQQYGDTVSDPNAACMLSSNNKACYEEDHLISLENGGDPRTRGTYGPNLTIRKSMGKRSAPDRRTLSRTTFTTRSALTFPATRATGPSHTLH